MVSLKRGAADVNSRGAGTNSIVVGRPCFGCCHIFSQRSIWKAGLIGAFVGGSALLGYGTRWVLKGAFALAVVAIAIALGLPPPDQWPQLLTEAREAVR